MGDSVLGWPFLVARGRRQGYRTLLAPDFLTSRNLHERLSNSTKSVKPGQIGQIELDYADGDLLSVTYTTEQLRGSDANGAADQAGGRRPPTDQHGRPLELLYGIVSLSRVAVPLDDEDLRTAREYALRTYQRFLADEDMFDVDGSHSFSLRSTPIDTRAPRQPPRAEMRRAAPPREQPVFAGGLTRQEPDDDVDGRTFPVLWVALATAAVVVALLAWLLLRHHPQVQIAAARACGQAGQVQLTATIQADPGTLVRYQWIEPSPTAATAPRLVRFKTAAPKSINTIDVTQTPLMAKFSLAILSPDPHTQRLAYSAICPSGR